MASRRTSRPIILTRQQARDIVLKHQLLYNPPILKGKRGTLKTIKHLGYVQIDTISVIERSHHIVLYTRCPTYQHKYLHELQACDRKIFEYWAHAASYIPMSDYRFYVRRMKQEHVYEKWMTRWSKKHRAVLKKVKKRIQKEGALAASDFADDPNRKRGPWWDWKPAKAALEVLFWKGELMITERRNFQRVYDLTERVLPADIDATMPNPTREAIFRVKRALQAMGIATIQDIKRYIISRKKYQEILSRLIKDGTVKEVSVKDINKPYYMLSKDIRKIPAARSTQGYSSLTFLSPFDNAIILRDRTEALFDFKYALECYTPPKKRTYGYFCLPVLWRNNLIGRFDPKADRKNGVLQIRSIYLEKPDLITDHFFSAFADALRSFASFHGCDSIKIDTVAPGKFRREIKKHNL